MRCIFFVAVFICLAISATAQIQVRFEPRHHNVFENEYVRILDVHIPPHDTTEYHIHSTPSVFLSFTKTTTGSQLMGRPPAKSNTSVPGRPSYDSLNTPRIHRVWNDDSIWFHVMDIELTAEKFHSNEPQIQNPLLKLVFDRPLANGYTLQLQTNNLIQLPASVAGYLVVSISDADINYTINGSMQRRFMKAGHYIWIDAGKPSMISSIGNTSAFMLLQLK